MGILYSGIITDTANFPRNKTVEHINYIAEFAEKGIDLDRINTHFLETIEKKKI